MTMRIDFTGEIAQSTVEAHEAGIINPAPYTGHFIYDDTIAHNSTSALFHHYEDFHDNVSEFLFNIGDITLTKSNVLKAEVFVSENRVYAIFDIKHTDKEKVISKIIPFQLGQHIENGQTTHPLTPIFNTLDLTTFTSATTTLKVNPVGYATGLLSSLIFTPM